MPLRLAAENLSVSLQSSDELLADATKPLHPPTQVREKMRF
jgi:hypothetical protein